MNRTVIIVKAPPVKRDQPIVEYSHSVKWLAIRLHWEYGDVVKQWLNSEYDSYDKALGLIFEGHRGDIKEKTSSTSERGRFWGFKTLKEAKEYCEHYTLAVHSGKRWRFEGK